MVKTYQALLCEAAKALQFCSDTPRLDAEVLLAHLLGRERVWFAIHGAETAHDEICEAFSGLVCRRKKGEPVAYLIGEREFMGLPFAVSEGVLIPRPDTETLVETVLRENTKDAPCILDLCTGSGAIAVSLAHFLPQAAVCAIDLSEKCLGIARQNAVKNRVEDRVTVRRGNVLAADFSLEKSDFPSGEEQADIVVSNPPYIRSGDLAELMPDVRDFEPTLALDGGADGLLFYRQIAELLPRLLKRGGLLALEVGHDQAETVAQILKESGETENIRFAHDLAGIRRVVLANRKQGKKFSVCGGEMR